MLSRATSGAGGSSHSTQRRGDYTERSKPAPKLELTPRQMEDLREAFNIFDSDGTGFISVNDFKIAMKALGFEADKEEIRSLMWGGVTGTGDSASRDRSAGITFQEFQNIMGVKMNQVDSDVDLERAFDLFDDDETGTITLRNLRRVARQLGEDEGEEELQAMIDAADRRGVGEVSLEDFKHVMRKATWAK
ncbi:hypothetical protein M8J77_020412 [Diaphorina citri]|nr:hypothetical protein M8J77_020412 [Diaphorina citri]